MLTLLAHDHADRLAPDDDIRTASGQERAGDLRWAIARGVLDHAQARRSQRPGDHDAPGSQLSSDHGGAGEAPSPQRGSEVDCRMCDAARGRGRVDVRW
jgi:hypothetical protein